MGTVLTIIIWSAVGIFSLLSIIAFLTGWYAFGSDDRIMEVRSAMVEVPGIFWPAWLIGFRLRQGGHFMVVWVSDRIPDEKTVADRRVRRRQKTMERILGKEL